MSNSQVAQRRSDGSAVCTVCRHTSYAEIRAQLDAGARVADISEQYGLSLSSIYRHRSNRHDALDLLAIDDADGLDLAERLDLMFTRATAGSGALYAAGDIRGAGQLGDHALRVGAALASLGIDKDTIKAEIQHALDIRRSARALARTLEAFAERHPEHVEQLALAAESVGARQLASDIRDDDSEEQS